MTLSEKPMSFTRDRRFRSAALSLSLWALIVAGIAEGPDHPKANADAHEVFVNCFEDMKRGQKFDVDAAKAFGLARRNLIDNTISKSNIIITTLSNTGEASLVKHFNPNVINRHVECPGKLRPDACFAPNDRRPGPTSACCTHQSGRKSSEQTSAAFILPSY